MREKIYVTGHQNPDTDSICSAIGYAYLKERLEDVEAIPLRLGSLNQETKFVLDYFDVEEPEMKDSMQPQVKDLNMDTGYGLSRKISLYKAMEIIQRDDLGALAIVDGDEQLEGIVTLSDITKSYMEIWDDFILGTSGTSLMNITEVLSAEIVFKPEKVRSFDGKMSIIAMDPEETKDLVSEGDIAICGNRYDARKMSIQSKASILILTGGFPLEEELLEKAKKKDVVVLSTQLSSFMAARLLPQAVPVSHIMTSKDLVTFHPEEIVHDVSDIMSQTRFRAYPVVDYQNKYLGMISRYHLISLNPKKLILVDHNEANQSIDHIEEAEILEIIDHHRVANIFTEKPIYFRNEPVGSTSTIVSSMYFESGILPPKPIAGLLCAAIISDTLLFKSPTATKKDKIILERMAKIAQLDVEDFAMKMFKEGTSLENKEPDDLLRTDVKRFVINDQPIRVAQVFTVDMDSIQPIKEDLITHMNRILVENNEKSFILMITHIFDETSEVLIAGSYGEELAESFDENLTGCSFLADGLLSRKKQMIPRITAIAERH